MNVAQKSIIRNSDYISFLYRLYGMNKPIEIPIYQKQNLTIEEAAVYSNIGRNKLREITDDEKCLFVLWVGGKRLIKRKLFDEFIEKVYSI